MKSQIGSPYAYGAAGELVTRDSINSLKGRFPSYASQGKYDFLEQFVDSGLRAFDCSGLMQWAFAKANINIGRSTYNQINAGIEVAISDINPGDLLFDNALGHVAMYIGNGQWIESPNSGKTVRITNVRWESVQRARRVLQGVTSFNSCKWQASIVASDKLKQFQVTSDKFQVKV